MGYTSPTAQYLRATSSCARANLPPMYPEKAHMAMTSTSARARETHPRRRVWSLGRELLMAM
eukprot:8963457-Pyramimonas_sp.AAC.1